MTVAFDWASAKYIWDVSHLFDVVTEEYKVHTAEAQLSDDQEQIHHTSSNIKTIQMCLCSSANLAMIHIF